MSVLGWAGLGWAGLAGAGLSDDESREVLRVAVPRCPSCSTLGNTANHYYHYNRACNLIVLVS